MKTLMFMLIISVICVGGVSTAFVMTKPQININEQMVKYKAVLFSANIAIPITSKEVEKVYQENVKEIKDNNGKIKYYQITGGKYAMDGTGTGLWGALKAVICFDQSLNKIIGIAFTYQNETPGLGGRIEEKWFKEQFRGKVPPISIAKGGRKADDHQFDAITGATITSTGVKNMVNKTQKEAREIINTPAYIKNGKPQSETFNK